MTRRRKTLLAILAVHLAAGGFAWYWQATAVDRAVARQVNALLAEVRSQPGRTNRKHYEVADDLAKVGRSAVPALIQALRDKDRDVRITAAMALGKLGDPRGVEPLIAALRDEDVAARAYAAWALGFLGDARAVEPLIAGLKDEDELVRYCAVLALGKLGDARAAEPLVAALRDENWKVRYRAASALGELGDPRGVKFLIAVLKDEDDEWFRPRAALALARLGDARGVEFLIAALKDDNSALRFYAAEALGELGDARGVEPLIAALRDENRDVRLFAAYCVWAYWPADNRITISPETTYITEPVNPDGTINYVAALDRMCSEGVTPENNAAPLLLRAVGPDVLDETVRRLILDRLDIDLPEDGDFFVTIGVYAEEHAPPTTQPGDQEDEEEETIKDRLGRARKAPWRAEEFPVIAAWLEANEKPLSLVIEATRRPRHYIPLVCASRPESMIGVAIPMYVSHIGLGRALAARAMLKLDAGDIEGARADLMAGHRLARLLGQDQTLVARMVSIAIEIYTCGSDIVLATSGKLTGPQARAFLAELESLPPLPDVAESIDKFERFTLLDALMGLSRGESPDETTGSGIRRLGRINVDWNLALRIVNGWYNRMVAAWRLPHSERRAANAALDDDMMKWRTSGGAGRTVAMCLQALGGRFTRKAFTHNFMNLLATMFVPELSRASELYDEARMELELAKLAMALAACKAETGKYPAKLDDLKPGYVKEIPQDIFTLKPLVYRSVGEGYLLYSLGCNMTDDGGKNHGDDPEAGEDTDDIAVEVK